MDASLAIAAYSPHEISALTNSRVVEDHAAQAAFLWRMRERAIEAPHYRLAQLARLDGRLLANLAGLQVAGATGLEQARKKLAEADRHTLFVFAYLAFAAKVREPMRDSIAIALSDAELMGGLLAALAWNEFDVVAQVLQLLGQSKDPTHRRMSIAVHAAHRVDPGDLLARAIHDSDPLLRARATRAIGELGRADLINQLRPNLSDPDPSCRFWAAWSLSLLGERRAPAVAFEVGAGDSALARTAIELAMRTGDPDWARLVIRDLSNDAETMRQAVIAAGAFGDAAVLGWLLDIAADNRLARVAAESFALITGVELERSDLKRDAPDGIEESNTEDDDLRWPNVEGLRRWWASQSTRFEPGQRYLRGLPVGQRAAVDALRDGYQRQRRAAAIDLAYTRRGSHLFPVAARTDWQRQRIAA
jgi:uncharacterized protein (TIGR02270 family)